MEKICEVQEHTERHYIETHEIMDLFIIRTHHIVPRVDVRALVQKGRQQCTTVFLLKGRRLHQVAYVYPYVFIHLSIYV